MKSVNLPLL